MICSGICAPLFNALSSNPKYASTFSSKSSRTMTMNPSGACPPLMLYLSVPLQATPEKVAVSQSCPLSAFTVNWQSVGAPFDGASD